VADVGTAYITIIPSFKGFAGKLQGGLAGEMVPASEKASEEAGKKGAGKFATGFKALAAGGALFGGVDALKGAFETSLNSAHLTSTLTNTFGLTQQAAAQSAKTAGTLYAQGWGESLTQAGTDVGQVSVALKNMGSTEDLTHVTAQAQALAKTFGEEVGPLATAAGNMVKVGLAKNASDAFDILTKGFQNGANSGQDLLDTFTEYSTQFQKLGLDGSTAMGLINQGLQAGARNSDQVADALKEFSIRAVDGSKTTSQGFQQLGLDAQQMSATMAKGGASAAGGLQLTLDKLRGIKDPVLQSQAAVNLFGTHAEDLGKSLYALSPASVSATGGMKNVGGAAQEVAQSVGAQNSQSIETFGRALQTSLGSGLSTITPVLFGILSAVQPLLPILLPMAGAMLAVTLAQWAWNAATAANPIMWIVGAIVAVIAGIVLLVMNWDKVTAKIREVARVIFEWVGGVKDKVVAKLSAFGHAVYDAVVQPVIDVYNGVVDWLGKIPERFGRLKDDIVNWVKGIPGMLVDAGKNLIQGFLNGIGLNGSAITDKLVQMVKDAVHGMLNFLGIASPSKLAHWIGDMTGQGLANGLDASGGKVQKSANSLARKAITPLTAPAVSVRAATTARVPLPFSTASPASNGVALTQNIYPQPRQDERSIGIHASRYLAHALKTGL
jgi:phage-related minor tail protein